MRVPDFLQRWISWLYTRVMFGSRCETHDLEDFADGEGAKTHCHTCFCGRCAVCWAWDEHDEVWG